MTITLAELQADMEAGTPGPWAVTSSTGDIYSQARNNRKWICQGPNAGALTVPDPAQGEANARRIARLPDTEAALIEAVGVLRLWAIYDSSVWEDGVNLMINYNNALKGTKALLAKLGADK